MSDKQQKNKGNDGKSQMNRRSFIARSAVAGLPLVVPATVLGRDGVAPSERTTIGMIGLGFLGRVHLHGLLNNPLVQIVALSDVDQWRLTDAGRMAKEAYENQKGMSWSGIGLHHDFLDLLARNDIDGVVLTMGDRWHAAAAKLTVEAGKDVFVEKPVSLTLAETRAISDAVQTNHAVSQSGIQQRSDPTYQRVCRFLRDGRLGKISNVYIIHSSVSQAVSLPAEPVPPTLDWERWLGPAPWRPYNSRFHQLGLPRSVVPWSFCSDFGNAGIADAAVHSFDIVLWALGLENSGPLEIIPVATGQYPYLTYRFPGDVMLQIVNNKIDHRVLNYPKGWDENTSLQSFGGVFVGENGWIHVGRMGYLTASSPDLIADVPPYYEGREYTVDVPFVKRGKHYWTTFYDHKMNWVKAIRTRGETAAPIQRGSDATRCSILGAMATRLNRALHWDPVKQEFQNDDEANRYRSRAAREPWNVG